VTDHTGFLSEADRGTLFLDEIGSIGRAAQAKFLRVLETQTYRVIGSAADRKSNFRTVAATNEPLEELTLRGLFREDLMWRLRGLVLHVPALSRRLEDVPLLARHFARQASTALGRHVDLSEEALDVLGDHNWPGHVRELRRAVEAAAALSFNVSISAEEIRNVLRNTMVSRAHGERDQLRHVLQSVNGDIDAAAEVLGVHRVTIYRRLKRLGITRSLVSDELPSRVQLQE
jgi:DNA-binding NtrC family response regulator